VSTPRDITFVLDVSGSMSGHKLEQARAAGRDLLATLSPHDRFRMIDFSTDVRTFRDDFESATPEHVREAEHYLDQLEADGATNIDGALAAALRTSSTNEGAEEGGAEASHGRLPIILFITDGEPTVGEKSPDVLVAHTVAKLGNARLFTFGLGADVNTSLLEQLALRGRGTAQFVRPDESVERAVSIVARRLTDPVVTDLAIHSDGVRLSQMLPTTLTELFAGQDLVILARYRDSGPTRLRFTGRTVNGPITWESTVTFPARERANPFVARLWATQRVGYLEAQRRSAGGSAELDAELKSLGEQYGIPTEFTSYLVQEQSLAMGGAGTGGMAFDAQGVRKSVPAAPPGVVSLNAAKSASEMRATTSLAEADQLVAGAARAADGPMAIRHAGARTFVLRDSVWTDTRYQKSGRLIRVQAFSSAYFALLQAEPELRDAFAAGDRVIVAGRQLSIEVTPAGVTQLAQAEVDAVRAGW
jgi:Ca-activated chloride channel family protein